MLTSLDAAIRPRADLAGTSHGLAEPVGLLNAYSTRNLGDAAIMTAIAEMSPSGRAAVRVSDDAPLPLRGVLLRAGLEECSRYVSVGGDIFNNARPRLVTRHFLAHLRELARHRRSTVVFGQTIPASCRGMSLHMLAAVLRRTRGVVVRDRQSLRLLEQHNVEALLSYDAAFALSPKAEDLRHARQWLAGQGLAPERLALLSVRPFDPMYPQDEQRFVSRLSRLASLLSDRGFQVCVMVQAAVGPADGDHDIAQRILAAEPRARLLDFLADAGADYDPVGRLLGTMALAEIVVAVRYHAAVLRLAAGRMPYHFHYSRKGADLSDRLQLPGADLAAMEPQAQLAAIESTAAQSFDPAPLEAHVRASFAWASARLP